MGGGGTTGIGEEVSLGRVWGYKGQGLRDSTRPLDGCGREKGAGTVVASDRTGKILTLNRENVRKMQKAYKHALFLRYLLEFLSD